MYWFNIPTSVLENAFLHFAIPSAAKPLTFSINYTQSAYVEGTGIGFWIHLSDGTRTVRLVLKNSASGIQTFKVQYDDGLGGGFVQQGTTVSRNTAYWQWYSVVVELTNSTTFKAWIDGQLIFNQSLSGSGVSGNITEAGLELNADVWGNTVYYVDDVVVHEGTRLGQCRIFPLLPTSDVSTELGKEPSGAASNAACVDDTGVNDGDSTYVYSSGTDESLEDVYELGNWVDPVDWVANRVLAVAGTCASKQNVGDGSTVTPGLQIDSSNYMGSNPLSPDTAGYTGIINIWSTNPDTAANWQKSELDGLRLIVRHTHP
jgi:hypothetical protein